MAITISFNFLGDKAGNPKIHLDAWAVNQTSLNFALSKSQPYNKIVM